MAVVSKIIDDRINNSKIDKNTDLQINLIPLRDTSWDKKRIDHRSSNLKVTTLDIEINCLRLTILHIKVSISVFLFLTL